MLWTKGHLIILGLNGDYRHTTHVKCFFFCFYYQVNKSNHFQLLERNKQSEINILQVRRRWCCPSCPAPKAQAATTGSIHSLQPSLEGAVEEAVAAVARPTRLSRPSRGSGRCGRPLSAKTRTGRSPIPLKEARRRTRRLEINRKHFLSIFVRLESAKRDWKKQPSNTCKKSCFTKKNWTKKLTPSPKESEQN